MSARISLNAEPRRQEAEVLALRAAAFLAADPGRLVHFLDLSGIDVQSLRASLADPSFLGGLLDHLLADETLLLMFAETEDIRPEQIVRLRRLLPGAAVDL
ncbi:MAG: DUF3572 family protein [Aestuariivirga sp.]|uniref:DUF3572 family protein n=1 Tax=Aestuariivirga sp. TaxID=2650926 RepID=UPI0038D0445F